MLCTRTGYHTGLTRLGGCGIPARDITESCGWSREKDERILLVSKSQSLVAEAQKGGYAHEEGYRSDGIWVRPAGRTQMKERPFPDAPKVAPRGIARVTKVPASGIVTLNAA